MSAETWAVLQVLAPDDRGGQLLAEALQAVGLRVGSVCVLPPQAPAAAGAWRTAAELVHLVESPPLQVANVWPSCLASGDAFL